MAHFWGGVVGRSKTDATRLGTKDSGLRTWAHGWDLGVSVTLRHVNGEDVVDVELTSGSNGGNRKHLGTFDRRDLDG